MLEPIVPDRVSNLILTSKQAAHSEKVFSFPLFTQLKPMFPLLRPYVFCLHHRESDRINSRLHKFTFKT